MRFIDFKMQLDIIMDTFSTSSISEAVEFTNDRIAGLIRFGRMLPCNKPKFRIYNNVIKSKLVFIPADRLTTYMSMTNGYNMNNTFHYDRFNKLLDTEPEFIEDVDSILNKYMRIANLESMESIDLTYYLKTFDFNNYDKTRFYEIIEALNTDFKLLQKNNSNGFNSFQMNVYNLIKRVDSLYAISREEFDADSAWKMVFSSSITPIANKFYFSKCDTPQFKNLYHIYTNRQMVKQEKKQSYKRVEPIVRHNPEQDMLKFMGLNKPFTQKQLKKRFRKLAIKFHPDKGYGDSSKFIYLKQCYETLNKNF